MFRRVLRPSSKNGNGKGMRANRSIGRKKRLLMETLESRLCLSVTFFDEDGSYYKELRENASKSEDVIYYDYVENLETGELSGGRLELKDLESWCTVLSPQMELQFRSHNVTTLWNNGPSSNRIDLVFVGDGYTNAELGNYANHVNNVLNPFFAETPLNTYKSFFNVHRVDVVSAESGVDHDPTYGVLKNTALDMGFWGSNIERLLIINTTKALAAAASAPAVDQVLAVANSAKYGGAGYPSLDLGTLAGNNGAAVEIALHEFGHSFADLADEYDYADGTSYVGGERPEANISIRNSAQMASMQTKWHLWLNESNVDTFEGAYYKQFGIYRPTSNSKMRSLNRPWEQVNIEQLVVSAYKTVRPIDSATAPGTYPAAKWLTVTPVVPIGHTLDVQWFLNGNPISGATQNSLDVSTLNLPAGSHTVSVSVVDNTPLVRSQSLRDTWMTETRSWTINAIANTPPSLSNLGDARTYLENADPLPIAPSITVTDPDSPDFAGGRLTVTIQSGGQSTDRLTIRNTDFMTINAGQIIFSGQSIGTVSGGVGTQALIINFNGRASLSRVQHVAKNVSFSNVSDAPSTAARTIGFRLTDGDGGSSNVPTKQMFVHAVNDRPVLGGISGSVNYQQNAVGIPISNQATVSDPDSPIFNGGVLTVAITNGKDGSNRVLVGGNVFAFDANNKLLRNGVEIGSRNVNGGFGQTNLVITFNANATRAIVQELIRTLRFRTVNGSNTLQRTITFRVSDGAGGTSDVVSRQVNVV